ETSEYEATRFLAMLQADDENFTPESSQYSNDWSATPAQEIFPTVHSENWHHRLGHVSASSISRIPTIATNFDTTTCESCILAKQPKLPFKSRQELEVAEKLQLVHSDPCGPLPPSIDGFTYFITFTDDYSRYSWVSALPNKSKMPIPNLIKGSNTFAQTVAVNTQALSHLSYHPMAYTLANSALHTSIQWHFKQNTQRYGTNNAYSLTSATILLVRSSSTCNCEGGAVR